MAALKRIFFWRKPKPNGRIMSPKEDGEESPINKMLRHNRENYGFPNGANLEDIYPEMDDPDYMSEEDQQKALKKLLPRTAQSFIQVKDSNHSIFPVDSRTLPQKALPPGTPVMDDAPSAKGTGLPGAVGAGMRPMANPRCACNTQGGSTKNGAYPPQNGYNSGIDTNGMNMIPDPLTRFPINPRVLKHFQSRIWITYSGCAVIATHEFINRACSIPAEDAIAHGYKVICSSHEHEHDDTHDANEARFLFDVKVEADKMGINDTCVQLNYKKKVFGVGIAIPRVKFREDAKSPKDPSGNTPYSYADEYDPKCIEPGSYQGFAVVDPMWLTYEFDEESSQDPISPYFYVPTWIHTRTRKIHRSWIIRVVNSEIPDLLKPTYYFGGLSLTQMIYERVWCADKLANEAPLLAMTKRLLIADGNLDQMISDARHTNIFFKAINYFRDNFSIFIKKPSSNVTQLDTSLSDLTPLTMAQYQLVAAIAQIPVTKLLKNVPSGLQATGEYEWNDYAQSLHTIQNNDYTPLLRKHYELYVASNYPERNDISLDVEWKPIDVPKESEIAQMCSQSAQYVSTLIGNGIITVAEARSMLRHTALSSFQALTPEVPEILEKLEDAKDPEKQAQMQQQMMGGMEGMPGMPGMGGGMPPMGGGGAAPAPEQQQEPVDPVVAKNDEIIKDALNRVKKAAGLPTEGDEQQQAQQQNQGQPTQPQAEQGQQNPQDQGKEGAQAQPNGSEGEETQDKQKPATVAENAVQAEQPTKPEQPQKEEEKK